jgi:tetratricopeptide (TPR) repeat protein
LAKRGDFDGALKRYRQALAVDEALAAADRADARSRRYLVLTCLKLGKVLLAEGKLADAQTNCSRAVAIVEDISRTDPMNADVKANLAESYAESGTVNERIASAAKTRPWALQHWRDARSWYERSRNVWLELRSRNALSRLNESEPERMAGAISRCNSALAK